MVLHVVHVSLHPTLAFVNHLYKNPLQIILIRCYPFTARTLTDTTLIETMGDIKAYVHVDGNDLVERGNLMQKRWKTFARKKVFNG